MVSEVSTEEEWLADRLYGSELAPCRPDHRADNGNPDEPVNLDVEVDAGPAAEPDPNAGARRTAMWLAGAVAIAVITIATVLLGPWTADPPPSQRPTPPPVVPAPPAAAPVSAAPTPSVDRALPYTASANCPAGSTSAQSLTDSARDSAWTCVRGEQGARVDGQVLHVDLGGSQVVSAVSVTPGWVAKTPGGKDEWLQHRVVTRLQYVFDDADHTIFTQDTGNAHGPVTTALPTRILASRVTVIVLQTARPPASPPPSVDPDTPAPAGLDGPVVGPTDQSAEDPVDATFSISALTFLGHQPM
jgi:hypothetical protein